MPVQPDGGTARGTGSRAELLAVQAVIARQLLPCQLRHGITAAKRTQPGEVLHAAAAAGGYCTLVVLFGGSTLGVLPWQQLHCRRRIHQHLHRRPQVAPGAQQTQRVARFQYHLRQSQPAALPCCHRQLQHVPGLGGNGKADAVARLNAVAGAQAVCLVADIAARLQRMTVQRAAVVQPQFEQRAVTREHRRHRAGRYLQLRQIAKGMQDAHQSHATEQEHQQIAQRQVVVDRADQHHQQGQRKAQALACRQDVEAALAENDGAGLGRMAVSQPL